MPYRDYDEFIQDVEDNPKLARLRVVRAKKAGIPVVDEDNEGYRKKTISKRMSRMTKIPAKPKYSSGVLRKRMAANKVEPEDETVAKRKQIGY